MTLKKYRVKERWITRIWQTVEASSEEEAIRKLENGEGDSKEEGSDYDETDWNTLQEVT